MRTFVSAVFDSVDMADIAAGRLRAKPGVLGFEVFRNRFVRQAEKKHGLPDYFSPYTDGGVVPFYFTPLVFGYTNGVSNNYEPALRRDALLKVEVNDTETAKKASAVLRNLGGHSINITRR